MSTARDKAQILDTDSITEMCAKMDTICQGIDILELALGDEWFVNQPMGEIMAAVDRDRIGTPSMYVSQIVEAIRFARSQTNQFQAFVECNRQEFDLAELEAAFA